MNEKVIPDPPLPSLEESLLQISDLLRCASATAYESADSLSGVQRDLAFSTQHLIEMARSILRGSLQRMEARL